MMKIEYSPMQSADACEVSGMIELAYNMFLAAGSSTEGYEAFKEAILPQKLEDYAADEQHVMWVAKFEQKIVGMAEINQAKHLRLLFVHPDYHYKGIAKELLYLGLKKSIAKNANLQRLTVKSSPYAVDFYKRQGFVEDGDWEEKKGIRYLPMTLKIKN